MDIFFDNINHDMELLGQDIAFTDDSNVVQQRLKKRLQFITNEWFLDRTVGLPYPQFIFEQGADLKDIYALFRSEIKNTNGVVKINTIQLTPQSGSKLLSIYLEVNDGVTVEVVI